MGILSGLGANALQTLTGGLVSGGVGALLGGIGQNRAQRNALALLQQQEESQRRLNAENAEMGFQYGEQAADAAHQRQLSLYETQKQDNSAESQVQDLKNAGLSVGLLYGGGGAGGAGGGSTKGAQGDGAGAMGAQAPNYLEVEAAKQQRKLTNAELARTANESRLANAEAKKIEAETKNIDEERMTSEELTPVQKELLYQEGWGKFLENARIDYENRGLRNKDGKARDVEYHNEIYKEGAGITQHGIFNQQKAVELAEAISRTEGNKAAAALDTEKKKGYWTELLNATTSANASAAQAAAVKLAAEWTTGEYTNWKTWTQLAGEASKVVEGLIKIVP